MPKYEITAPDGKKFEVTAPDGTTQEQALLYFQNNYKPTQQQAPQPQDNQSLLSRYWDLSKQESGREGTGALTAVYGLGQTVANPLAGAAQRLGLPGQEWLNRRVDTANVFLKQREKDLAEEAKQKGWDQFLNVPGTAGEIVASSAMYPYGLGKKGAEIAAGAIPKVSGPLMEGAKRLGRVFREGVIGSTLFTPVTGEGDYTSQKAVQAGVGGLTSLGFAGAGKTISATGGAIAKKIAGKAPTEIMPVNLDQLKFADVQSMAGTNKEADIRAVNKVVDTLKEQFPDNYQSVIDEWAKSGKPLAEVIPKQVTQLAETAAMYPQGEELAQKYFSGQAAGSAERINKSIAENVSPIGDVTDTVAKRVELGQKAAAPLYKEAFQSTGIAPLKNTLQKQWASAGNTIGSLKKELNSLKQEMDLTAGKEASRPFNVYGQSNINQSKRDLAQKIEAKTQELESAISEREQIASFMKEAMADEAAGKKAVWSPRLQEFLDSPSYKGALAKGKAAIEQENLNKKIKTKVSDFEYGIKGYDANGEPIVSKVPNLRMLDAYKKGMDEIINSHRNQFGDLDNEGKRLAANQAAFVDEIDRIIGTQHPYARARKVAGEYITAKNATIKGQKEFFSTNPEILKRDFKKMTPSQQAAYKDGVVAAARERMGKILETGGNPYPKLMGKTDDVRRWQQILSPKEFKNFYESLKAEDLLFKTRNQVLGNSATARRQNQIKDFELTGAEVLTPTGTLKTLGLSKISGWLKKQTASLTDNMAGSVAKLLYEDNPRQKALLMKQVFGDERLSAKEKQIIKDVYLRAENPIEELKVRLRAGASATATNAMQQ